MANIYFDMDGTIANLYQVNNWLEKLIAADPSPYAEAAPMVHLSTLARILNKLQKQGHHIGIISWLSKNSTDKYDMQVSEAKRKWLKNHMPSVHWNEIHIVKYGTPKSSIAHMSTKTILFDDEQPNLTEWNKAGGKGYKPERIFEVLKAL